MIRHIFFTYVLVISVTNISGTCTDEGLKVENPTTELINHGMFQQESCNETSPCPNDGICLKGACRYPKECSGDWCEAPNWCTKGRCGYRDDVKCVEDPKEGKGYCQCQRPNRYYDPKDRMCQVCTCGVYGSCVVVDNVMVCVCEKGYAVESGKCIECDCGTQAERCYYDSYGDKKCLCKKGYDSLPGRLRLYGAYCEECDCGEHGHCWFDRDDNKRCDCDDSYRSFKGKCVECDCGPYGTCALDKEGKQICSCDYGYAEKNGKCLTCDCNYVSKRDPNINCTFIEGIPKCGCPPGYELTEPHGTYCRDINECLTSHPCPDSTDCVNQIGTYDCKCKKGFEPMNPSSKVKISGCKDIDECADSPCKIPATKCVNTVGSYDCVCKDGFYPTAATGGYFYKPAYNNCYEKETQWRAASIALGVIFSIGIIWTVYYIYKHKQR